MPGRGIEAQVNSPATFITDQSRLDLLVQPLAASDDVVPSPRWLLVFAHPDDEVLALGAHLERLAASRILTITDGAPVDGADAQHHGYGSLAAYRAARRQELFAALAHAGLCPATAPEFPLRVPDQQASFYLPALTQALAAEIQAFKPQAILTHSYEGGHPDHDACAFAVHTAVRLAATTQAPTLLEAPSYHAGSDGAMITGAFLSPDEAFIEHIFKLTPQQQRNKAARLACFASQAETLAQFGLHDERLRLAPTYDFIQPPHPGQLFYERFPWGMSGDRFRQLTSEALKELFGPEVIPEDAPQTRAQTQTQAR